ncbi:UDP-Gal or UDP-GlcNAc-dependent glycosyltransferase, putative [Trypanosoma brucei gambiense DAL972]|uniref:Hexosyltransferase n=1 Tax=Trypanosoma brucei gambiense (strain MHOM/CI/86/DAL972) TaxID=679716 RepID=C9ZWL0_TRYB9|nr:UDP-Gal or UDP-GlcNAc-dependent glycosyltransferase, putative [Trypanosoma brucei gambiense DAL972]CBH13799.1 UDP-Gal or UDP-GlcNAc-dependent glycosyltransferase, putative [Trypanosoma brucei gambiense DAL972]|eukprot:XP_011776075.1 UDP-Gal or UDP-GlcNAc-dependent glycosyltransferase, putative [Trypanosoma brucei gambiense DAL972]
MLPTNDVCSFSRRKIGEGGSWGVESELVMSRKTFLWLQFAVTAFPNVSYIVKGDDDVFVRVPQYLADLRVMPRNGLYMGRVYGATFFWRSGGIPFAAGYFTTFSRDVAEAVASYRPLERLLKAPYSIWRMRQYLSMSVLHEDVMTALVLQDKIRYKGLIIVDAAPCHFHNAGKGDVAQHFTSVCLPPCDGKLGPFLRTIRRRFGGTAKLPCWPEEENNYLTRNSPVYIVYVIHPVKP